MAELMLPVAPITAKVFSVSMIDCFLIQQSYHEHMLSSIARQAKASIKIMLFCGLTFKMTSSAENFRNRSNQKPFLSF
jgi:hypothetical protein